MADTQTYVVHLRTGGGSKEVLVRSDSPPLFATIQNPSVPAGFMQLGEGFFQMSEVLAVLPK